MKYVYRAFIPTSLYPKMVHADDFADAAAPTVSGIQKNRTGMKRSWLKAFETAPNQMLSSYGVAKYSVMSDEEVWENVILPLKSGSE